MSVVSTSTLEELRRHKDILEAAAPPDPSQPLSDAALLEIFSTLQSFGNVDRATLARTKIAFAVTRYKQHSSPEVGAVAKKLIAHWRGVVGAKTTAGAGGSSRDGTPGDSSTGSTEGPVSAAMAPATVAAAAATSLFADPAPGIDTLVFEGPYANDVKRDRIREILFKAFVEGMPKHQLANLDNQMVGQLMAVIEDALYAEYFQNPHRSQKNASRDCQLQLRSIKANFADRKNPEFNVRVYLGAIPAEKLAVMPSTEMASDARKAERQRAKRDALEACQSDWDLRNVKRAAGQFPCGKCKSANTTYFQVQTRSADEPMTTYVNCLECGNRWKF